MATTQEPNDAVPEDKQTEQISDTPAKKLDQVQAVRSPIHGHTANTVADNSTQT